VDSEGNVESPPGVADKKLFSPAVKVVALLIVLGIVGYLSTAAMGSGSSENGDASAQLACRDFNDVGPKADQMTNGGLHDRLQDILNTAEASDTPGIPEAARAMLSTMESFDITAFEGAVDDMIDACSEVEPP